MKIALIGATGFVGTAVLKEAVSRGHKVTAIQRHPENLQLKDDKVKPLKADVFDAENLGLLVSGHDLVISAYNPGWTNPRIREEFLTGSRSIIQAVTLSGVKRFIYIGGAGSLYLTPGNQLVDSPHFPAEYKQGAMGLRDVYELLKKDQLLNWTFVSPAIELNAETSGTRTGVFRLGDDYPVSDDKGRSFISVEDLAVAVVNEAEHPQFIRRRFTIGY